MDFGNGWSMQNSLIRVREQTIAQVLDVMERLARLGARVVELARLSNHDRTGADDEHPLDVGTAWHGDC